MRLAHVLPAARSRGGISPLCAAIVFFSIACPSQATDPDIEELLRTAPPPGDYQYAVGFPRFELNLQGNAVPAKADPQTLSKLLHIRIPRLDFKAMPGRDAFQWLVQQSVALDPQHQGITIVYALDGVRASASVKSMDEKITLSRSDVPLDLALRYVTDELKLRFDVEGSAVVIRPSK